MVITAIKQQVKNQNRASIFLDGEYSFSLSIDELYDQKIKVGAEIDEARLVELKKQSSLGKLYDRALGYVAIRERSRKEVYTYLIRKGLEPEEADSIIKRLIGKNYIDDERFARMWLDNRLRLKNSSLRLVKSELKQKGISADIISKIMPLENQETDKDSLRKLIAKKRSISRYSDTQKLKRYLITKGFSYDSIVGVLGEVIEE